MNKLKVSHFKTHKKGETIDDCQDDYGLNEENGRFAVADGATLSFFPKEWAELLVKYYCNKKDENLTLNEKNWKEWIKPIQQEWIELVSKIVQESKSYILVDRLSQHESALSTFIGIEFNRERSEWDALIIGDSCLFHLRNSKCISFPLKKSDDFPYRPDSFASFPKDNPVGGPPRKENGTIIPGDILILATDALSKWILQNYEAKGLSPIIDKLTNLEQQEQFEYFVEQARNDELRLVNDDVTLMVISIEECEISDDHEGVNNIPNEDSQTISKLISFIFWAFLAGVFGFIVGFVILVIVLLNKN